MDSLISIIVPCFNYGWVLAETLDSLLAQTYTRWECIVVDDGSTDNTRAVAEDYQRRDTRFRYVYQHNAGLSSARNGGLAVIRGDYVQFLDADDLLAPRKLERQVAYLEKHSEVDILYGDVQYFLHGAADKVSRSMNMLDQQWVIRVPETGDTLVEALTRGNIMVVNSPLVRASLIHKVGPFNAQLRSMEDWEYWLRCALAGARMHYDASADTWALVRVHPTSMSQNIQRMTDAILEVRRLLHGWLLENKAGTAQKINDEGITECYVSAARYNLLKGSTYIAFSDTFIIECYVSAARYNLLKGSIVVGTKGFLVAARRTGQYAYYLKSVPFWLRQRTRTP